MNPQQQAMPMPADIAQGQPPQQGGQMSTPNNIANPMGAMTQNFNTEILNPMKGAMNASMGRASKSAGSRGTALTG